MTGHSLWNITNDQLYKELTEVDISGKTIVRREVSSDGKTWAEFIPIQTTNSQAVSGGGMFAALMNGRKMYLRYIFTDTVDGVGALQYASEVMEVTSTKFDG